MSFDITALNAFRNVNLGGDKAIANLGEGDKVVKKNDYYGPIGKIFRGGAAKAANNAVRTELLRSLGNAFGLSGMSEKDGTVTFSKAFMDKLSDLLGPAFKRDDFGVGADGTVKSGKPLTQRRISAIVKQAKIVSQGAFDYDVYTTKLAHANEVVAKLPGDNQKLKERLELAGKLIDFIHEDLDTMIDNNPDYDLEYAKVDHDPQFSTKYVFNFRDEHGNKGSELFEEHRCIEQVRARLHDQFGVPMHICENILPNTTCAKPSQLTNPREQITAYVRKVVTNYVETTLGTFFAAEKAGQLKEFSRSIGNDVCLEAKTDAIATFRLMNLPLEDVVQDEVPGNGPVEAPVAVPVATHDKDQPLNQCIGREITALVQADPSIERWDQVADRVKENLRDAIRPIDIPVKTGEFVDDDGEKVTTYKFEPLLDNEGRPVVRKITPEDIDRLGEAVMSTILNG